MLTCVIRYQIDRDDHAAFDRYAAHWEEAIPRCGARLHGYFAPHEGSATTAYGIYEVESLAHYEAYRARLKADPAGQAAYAFAAERRFIRREDRLWLRRAGLAPA